MQPQPMVYVLAHLHTQEPQPQGQATTYTWIASTARPDDNGNLFDLAGWELDTYRRNPVVFAAHAWDTLPIARATKVDVDQAKQALVATIEFATTPRAAEVRSLVDGGFLTAMSVGALPLEAEPRQDPTTGRIVGIHSHRHSLRELSLVPVPANVDAVRIAALTEGTEDRAILTLLRTLKESPWTPQP